MSKEIDWRTAYSEDEIEQAFSEAFTKPSTYNDVSTWEALVEWEGDEVTVVLEVTSMAGDKTKQQFEECKELTALDITLFDGESVHFKVREVLTLNGTDYRAIYIPGEDDVEDEGDVEDETGEDETGEDVEFSSDLAGSVGWDEIGDE